MYEDESTQERAENAKILREAGVHKLVIADRNGNCLAYLLAWDSFRYDAETDTYVCFVDCDGRELLNLYTEGDVKHDPGRHTYVVTAPTANTASEITDRVIDVAS